jgi:hypothetical protein
MDASEPKTTLPPRPSLLPPKLRPQRPGLLRLEITDFNAATIVWWHMSLSVGVKFLRFRSIWQLLAIADTSSCDRDLRLPSSETPAL